MRNFNIIITSSDEKALRDWNKKLIDDGHNVVGKYSSLSETVDFLLKNDVDIIYISEDLAVDDLSAKVLKAVTGFFPRLKILIIGDVVLSYTFPGCENIACSKVFTTSLEALLKPKEKDAVIELNDSRIISELLSEHFYSKEKAERLFAKLGQSVEPNYVVMCILSAENSAAIYRVITDFEISSGVKIAIEYSISEVFLVIGKAPGEDNCLAIADKIRIQLLENTDVSFTIGISRACNTAYELYIKKKEALFAANSSYLFGRNSVVHINYIDSNDSWYAYPKHKEARLIQSTLEGDKETAILMLDDIFKVISEYKYSQTLINRICIRIWSDLNIAAMCRIKSFNTAVMDTIPFGKVFTIKNPELAYDYLKDGIISLATEVEEFFKVKRDVLVMSVSKAKSKDKNITVSEITRSYHTTVNFLNQALMDNTNHTVFEFFDE